MEQMAKQTNSARSRHTGFPFRFSVIVFTQKGDGHFDAMMESLVRQTFGFQSHIQVVIVDDGSACRIAKKAAPWINLYPENIRHLSQKNDTISDVRNAWLSEATSEWILFIEAEDLLAHTFFQEIQRIISNQAFDSNILVSNSLLFDEATGAFFENNESVNRFQETKVVDLLQKPELMLLTANGCLIRRNALTETGVLFDEKIKPSFASGHLINILLLRSRDFRVAFIKEAHHMQRIREDGEALTRQGWNSPEKYQDQMLFGYLNMLKQYKQALGQVPVFIQNIILQECSGYMLHLLEGSLPCPLSKEQQDAFFQLASLLFQYVDLRQILLSSLPSLDTRTRIAMLRTFKSAVFSAMPFVIGEVAPGGREAHLIHWSTEASTYTLRDTEGKRVSLRDKRIEHQFKGRTLCHEYRCWIPLHTEQSLRMEVDGNRANILCRNYLLERLDKDTVLGQYYRPADQLPDQQKNIIAKIAQSDTDRFEGAWLLMDRILKADDNAEHLCRWILKNHPKQQVFFILDIRSVDWDRLQREGFPLLKYGSLDHYGALTRATWLLSSHVDSPVIDPLQTRQQFGLPNYRTAFLQHGITMADISRWLNSISLDCIITSARPEHASMMQGAYKFTERELVLAGFPRHDALLNKARKHKAGKVILLCPTWREGLMRRAVHGLKSTQANEIFVRSDFYKKWNEIVSSPQIARLVRDNGCRMIFLPHPETERFLSLFTPSQACSLLRWSDVKSIQDLFVNSAMAVTDYSSIVLDLSFIGTPVAYYQFNETPPYYDLQGRKPSYFDYKKTGMGPVVQTFGAVKEWLSKTFAQECRRPSLYEERAAAFYHLRDGRNCRRVYEAIMARS